MSKPNIDEVMDSYQAKLAEAERSGGIVDENLANAYYVLTGTVLPSEYMGLPIRKFSGTSFDLHNLSITKPVGNP